MNLPRLAFALVIAFTALQAGATPADKPVYDPALAAATGADAHGMRAYVLVILKTGPNKIPAGPERDEMFKGHMANIGRLVDAGKLAVAGPFVAQKGVPSDGWRGLFIFAVSTVEEAQQLVATDPVIQKGEMVAEYHPLYSSAALMLVKEGHGKVAKDSF
ncbi:MAG: hypothetical protein JO006_04495 [Paucibacter sp.]|nr:hypothetical protein [Roseateles sp.]